MNYIPLHTYHKLQTLTNLVALVIIPFDELMETCKIMIYNNYDDAIYK